MRDYSKISPGVWHSQKFRKLPSMEARHVYLYLLTCPHGNSAGCFTLAAGYASEDLGMEIKQYRDCIEALCQAGLIEYDAAENTVLIARWLDFNGPANSKHAAGILAQLKQAASETLRAKCFQVLSGIIKAKKFDTEASVRNRMQTFFEQSPNGIATSTSTSTKPNLNETKRDETSTSPPLHASAQGGEALAAQEPEHPELPPALKRPRAAPSAELVQAAKRIGSLQ